MDRTFKIESAKISTVATLIALAALCCLLAIATVHVLPTPAVLTYLIAAPVLGIGLLMAWFAFAQRQSSVSILDRQIKLRVPLYGRTMSLDEIVAGSPSKVNLSHDPDFRLTWRTNGLGVPGYLLGWFRSRGAANVLAAVTRPEAVKWSTLGGYTVLVSVAEADAFLAALNEAPSRV